MKQFVFAAKMKQHYGKFRPITDGCSQRHPIQASMQYESVQQIQRDVHSGGYSHRGYNAPFIPVQRHDKTENGLKKKRRDTKAVSSQIIGRLNSQRFVRSHDSGNPIRTSKQKEHKQRSACCTGGEGRSKNSADTIFFSLSQRLAAFNNRSDAKHAAQAYDAQKNRVRKAKGRYGCFPETLPGNDSIYDIARHKNRCRKTGRDHIFVKKTSDDHFHSPFIAPPETLYRSSQHSFIL